jgi:very-short-patch-repair endonuclease
MRVISSFERFSKTKIALTPPLPEYRERRQVFAWTRRTSLRNRNLGGFKFRRQQPVAPFIADFYCVEAKLVIEVDGDSHGERREYDERRTQEIAKDGARVMRFTNSEVSGSLDAVLEAILTECQKRIGRPD